MVVTTFFSERVRLVSKLIVTGADFRPCLARVFGCARVLLSRSYRYGKVGSLKALNEKRRKSTSLFMVLKVFYLSLLIDQL